MPSRSSEAFVSRSNFRKFKWDSEKKHGRRCLITPAAYFLLESFPNFRDDRRNTEKLPFFRNENYH